MCGCGRGGGLRIERGSRDARAVVLGVEGEEEFEEEDGGDAGGLLRCCVVIH
jgi:hypothetical protein